MIGKRVLTAYGEGLCVGYRRDDGVYTVELPFGNATLYTQHVRQKLNDEKLNEMYQSYEDMRVQNLKLELQTLGLNITDEDACVYCSCCLRAYTKPKQLRTWALDNETNQPRFPKLHQLRVDSQHRNSINACKTLGSPCLTCGSIVCKKHSDRFFRREGVTVCVECVDILDHPQDRSLTEQYYPDQLTDLYDRAVLLFQYSSQYLPQISDLLERQTKWHGKIQTGGSATGLVSGVVGVVAAVSLLTPAGPPLLIASLVFGGSATAVQTTSDLQLHYSDVNQFANRILCLSAILKRITGTVQTMRDHTVLPFLDGHLEQLQRQQQSFSNNPTKQHLAKHTAQLGSTAVLGATATTKLVVQETTTASRFVSRAGTAAARGARFAQLAGGLLSAATIVLEVKELHHLLRNWSSPCEKSKQLRQLHSEFLVDLLSTRSVHAIVSSFVTLQQQQQAATEQEDPTAESSEASETLVGMEEANDDDSLLRNIIELLESAIPEDEQVEARQQPLLHRIQRYKEREQREQAALNLIL